MKAYGKSEEEKKAEKMLQVRQINKEIMDFGISEDQKLLLLYCFLPFLYPYY